MSQILTKANFHPLLKPDLRVEIVEKTEFTAKVKVINSPIKGIFEGSLNQLRGLGEKTEKPAPVLVERIGQSYKATVFFHKGTKSVILKNKLLAEDYLNAPPEKLTGYKKLPRLVREYVKRHSTI